MYRTPPLRKHEKPALNRLLCHHTQPTLRIQHLKREDRVTDMILRSETWIYRASQSLRKGCP